MCVGAAVNTTYISLHENQTFLLHENTFQLFKLVDVSVQTTDIKHQSSCVTWDMSSSLSKHHHTSTLSNHFCCNSHTNTIYDNCHDRSFWAVGLHYGCEKVYIALQSFMLAGLGEHDNGGFFSMSRTADAGWDESWADHMSCVWWEEMQWEEVDWSF